MTQRGMPPAMIQEKSTKEAEMQLLSIPQCGLRENLNLNHPLSEMYESMYSLLHCKEQNIPLSTELT